jgi:hypothetical protein
MVVVVDNNGGVDVVTVWENLAPSSIFDWFRFGNPYPYP